jgi:hypothetical protein
VNVGVGTPEDLQRHKTRLRSVLQEHELTGVRDDHRIGRAIRYEDEIVARGPRGLDSMAFVDGELSAGELADRARAQRHNELHLLTETLEMLQKSGHLDRMDFDPRNIAEELSLRLTGARETLAPAQSPALAAPKADLPGSRRRADDGGAQSDPDERPSRPQERSWYTDDDGEQ